MGVALANKPDTVRLSITARHGFVAPEGWSLVSIDYSNQEMYIAAILSGDEVMLNAFRPDQEVADYIFYLTDDGKILMKDGKPVMVKNPLKDLHTQTSLSCCHPHLFVGKQPHQYIEIAKDKSLTPTGKPSRDYAKTVNFGILYMQTAVAMSQQNYITEEEAEVWIKNHKEKYHTFHSWAAEVASLSTARGWYRNQSTGRLRWVQEDNSKSAGASPARSGVNFGIQGQWLLY